ncbi:hypothetical protein OSTOST_16665 [Ostertagia ostertagi]
MRPNSRVQIFADVEPIRIGLFVLWERKRSVPIAREPDWRTLIPERISSINLYQPLYRSTRTTHYMFWRRIF